MGSLRDYIPGAAKENPIVQDAQQKIETLRGDLGQAVVDWYEGAEAGIKEIERAATNLGANASPEQIRERILTGMADMEEIDDPNEQQAIQWYDKATKTFQQETVQPLAVGAAALGGLPGLGVMLPLMLDSTRENIENLGISQGLLKTAKDMVPIYGTVSQEGWGEYTDEHPLRAALTLGFDAASLIHPAVDGAKRVRKNYLIKKGKKTPLEAERIVKAEFDMPQAKAAKQAEPAAPSEPKTPKNTLRKSARKKRGRKTSNFETAALKGEEAIDPVRNSKVSKRIDEKIRKGFEELKEIDEQIKDFRGAFGEEIEPLPPSDLNLKVTVNQIRKLADSITPVRLGHLRSPKNVMGYTYIEQGGARVRKLQSDFSIMCHELGHYIDNQLHIQGADAELIQRVQTGRLKNSPYKDYEWRAEGIAEFTATYLRNPEKAAEHYPQYFQLFKKELASHPELAQKINTLSEYIRAWEHQNDGARVRGTMQFQDEAKPTLKEKATKLAHDTYKEWVDDTHDLGKVVKDAGFDNLAFDDNPQNFALALKNTIPGRVNSLLGNVRVSTEAIIGALEDIYNIPLHKVTLKDVYEPLRRLSANKSLNGYLEKMNAKDWHEAFATYAYARHALEVFNVQTRRAMDKVDVEIKAVSKKILKATSFDEQMKLRDELIKLKSKRDRIASGDESTYKLPNELKDYKAVLKEAPEELREASYLLTAYNENLLDIAVAYGRLDKKTAEFFKTEYPHYVPLTRDFSIEQGTFRTARAKEAYVNIDNFFKTLSEEGSERVVKDPLAGMAQATQKLISDGEHNIVGQKLAALAEREGGSTLMVLSDLGKAVGKNAASPAENIVYVWKNGKKYAYQTTVPGLYEAITNMSKSEGYFVSKAFDTAMRTPASILRIGATASPFYIMWQFIKDSFFSGLVTKTGMKGGVGTVKGLSRFFRQADEYLLAKFEAEGIGFSTRVGAEGMTKELRKFAQAPSKWRQNPLSKGLLKGVEKGLDIGYITDAAPRIEEFRRGMMQGMSQAEAAAAARDITLNFSRAGSRGRSLNRISAFFNAQVQGTDKLIRAFRENPRQVLMMSSLYLTLPTIAYWAMNKDKDWYRDLPYEDKMRNWYIQNPLSGGIYKLPKPDLIGYMFASVPEAILNSVYTNDKEALTRDNLGAFLLWNTVPTNGIPTGMRPLVENFFNYNFFRASSVVSPKELKKEDADQYNAYTSEIAKGIGRKIDYSPMKIDNVLKGTTGSLGQIFLDLIDKGLQDNKRPEREMYESIRFYYAPGGRTRTSDVFYKGLEKVEKRYNSSNQREKAAEYKGMKKAQQSITKIRRQINHVLNNDKLSAAQKREYIDKYNKQINSIQRKANSRYLGYKYIQTP